MNKLIVIEGVDGSGKSTLAVKLAETLGCYLTREPSRGSIGRIIRDCLNGRPHSNEELGLLFAADRLAHIRLEIEPALEWGHVVCDRYLASSLAYQSMFCPLEWVYEINKYARQPDITIFLDLAPELAAARLATGGKGEIYDRLEIIEKTRDNYLSALKNAFVIDASMSADRVLAKAILFLEEQHGIHL